MSEILVIGGGFAGLWAALGAARRREEAGLGEDALRIRLVNRDRWHAIRVRNYEPDLSEVRVGLPEMLAAAGIELVEGEATDIDPAARRVLVDGTAGRQPLSYDRLVLAAGSALPVPPIPGLAEFAQNVDTYDAGARLNERIAALAGRADAPGRDTAVVIGAGLTGIEVACELPEKLRAAGIAAPRVMLIDRGPHIGSDMGAEARAVIATALEALGVETRTGVEVAAVDAGGIRLADGTRILAATVVWTAGMRASRLAGALGRPLDSLGRVAVDPDLRVDGADGVFAAGDVAAAMLTPGHLSVMSCQHGRPMGRFAGHNVVADLLGAEMLALEIPHYVTCLDLGSWGAVYTEGWDRRVAATGADAKRTKQTINRIRIYPPAGADRAALLAAAEPAIQAPPRRKVA